MAAIIDDSIRAKEELDCVSYAANHECDTHFPMDVMHRLKLQLWTMTLAFKFAIVFCCVTHLIFRQNCTPSPIPNFRYFMTSSCSFCNVSKHAARHLSSVCFLFSPNFSRNDLS